MIYPLLPWSKTAYNHPGFEIRQHLQPTPWRVGLRMRRSRAPWSPERAL